MSVKYQLHICKYFFYNKISLVKSCNLGIYILNSISSRSGQNKPLSQKITLKIYVGGFNKKYLQDIIVLFIINITHFIESMGYFAVILRDKTMDDQLTYIPNVDRQKYHYSSLSLLV